MRGAGLTRQTVPQQMNSLLLWSEVPDEYCRRTVLVDDTTPPQGVHPAACLPDHYVDPAGDLAVPLWQPVQEGRRAARVRLHVVPRLSDSRSRGDERHVREHVGGYGDA